MTTETVVVNQITGAKMIVGKSAFAPMGYPELTLRHQTPGLKAENRSTSIRFTFERAEEITEADARDAQCRAGWSDTGYGFWGFTAEQTEAGWVANWACMKSCD